MLRLLNRLYCCLLVATSIAVSVVLWGRELRTFISPLAGSRPPVDPQSDAREFRRQWCRVQRWRIEWERAVQPCKGEMAWHQRKPASRDRTSAYRSYISKWELKRAGQFSRFFIQSVTTDRRLRKSGGDSWRVYIRQGPSSLAPLVLDHDDGLYEVLFLVMEPGSYTATVYLDHTLCDGYRDPPLDWFNEGADQGRYRAGRTSTTLLGDINTDYINKPLGGGTHVHFNIREPAAYSSKEAEDSDEAVDWIIANRSCHVACSLVWNGHGRWVGSHWSPYSPQDTDLSEKSLPNPRLFKLVILGDSNARRLSAVARKRPLCRAMFQKCSLTENWIYNARNTYPEDKVEEGDAFDQDIILQQYREILSQPDMDRVDSVLLFNMGIHYSLVLNFTQYQALVTGVVRLLTETTADGVTPRYKAHVIWRGTTMIEREKLTREPWPAMRLDTPLFRFHTNQRIQLFHAYATHAMCRAGIAVLDMYPLTAAYPRGTMDNVHYDYQAFEPALERLERYLSQRTLG